VILVVGLGNPGPRYAATRHNIGFQVVDRLTEKHRAAAWRDKFHGQFSAFDWSSERLLVLKPMTYMNESGRSVAAAVAFYKLEVDRLLVVHDELDLPFGEPRLKFGGGDAGHRGLRSLAACLKTSDFARLRMGIGHPPPEFGGSARDYVLEGFPLANQAEVEQMIGRGVEAIELFAGRGLSAAMNIINQRLKC
jgi:PTH1 family peptidyl-tRNA hydrolase